MTHISPRWHLAGFLLLCSCSVIAKPGDGSVVVAADSPNLQFLDRSLDRAGPDLALDRGASDLHAVPDKSPDKGVSVDKPPVDPCPTTWSQWACAPSPLPGGCIAKCGKYTLTCTPGLPLLPQACTCVKGTQQKTCTGDGVLCDACDDAMKSCCSKF